MGKNIVLIGLPGSGKTTVSALLAAAMGRRAVDTDEMVVRKEGRSIPEIFAAQGEAYFRAVETACAKEAGQLENAVIATGGGMVLKAENMAALKQNGKVYFLDRPAQEIAGSVDTSGRPLLKDDREKIFRLQKNICIVKGFGYVFSLSKSGCFQQKTAFYKKSKKNEKEC